MQALSLGVSRALGSGRLGLTVNAAPFLQTATGTVAVVTLPGGRDLPATQSLVAPNTGVTWTLTRSGAGVGGLSASSLAVYGAVPIGDIFPVRLRFATATGQPFTVSTGVIGVAENIVSFAGNSASNQISGDVWTASDGSPEGVPYTIGAGFSNLEQAGESRVTFANAAGRIFMAGVTAAEPWLRLDMEPGGLRVRIGTAVDDTVSLAAFSPAFAFVRAAAAIAADGSTAFLRIDDAGGTSITRTFDLTGAPMPDLRYSELAGGGLSRTSSQNYNPRGLFLAACVRVTAATGAVSFPSTGLNPFRIGKRATAVIGDLAPLISALRAASNAPTVVAGALNALLAQPVAGQARAINWELAFAGGFNSLTGVATLGAISGDVLTWTPSAAGSQDVSITVTDRRDVTATASVAVQVADAEARAVIGDRRILHELEVTPGALWLQAGTPPAGVVWSQGAAQLYAPVALTAAAAPRLLTYTAPGRQTRRVKIGTDRPGQAIIGNGASYLNAGTANSATPPTGFIGSDPTSMTVAWRIRLPARALVTPVTAHLVGWIGRSQVSVTTLGRVSAEWLRDATPRTVAALDTGTLAPGLDLFDGLWHVIVCDIRNVVAGTPGLARIFVDGVLCASQAITDVALAGGIDITRGAWRIGANAGSSTIGVLGAGQEIDWCAMRFGAVVDAALYGTGDDPAPPDSAATHDVLARGTLAEWNAATLRAAAGMTWTRTGAAFTTASPAVQAPDTLLLTHLAAFGDGAQARGALAAASPATVEVTTFADSGPGSLRALAATPGNYIVFRQAGQYLLDAPLNFSALSDAQDAQITLDARYADGPVEIYGNRWQQDRGEFVSRRIFYHAGTGRVPFASSGIDSLSLGDFGGYTEPRHKVRRVYFDGGGASWGKDGAVDIVVNPSRAPTPAEIATGLVDVGVDEVTFDGFLFGLHGNDGTHLDEGKRVGEEAGHPDAFLISGSNGRISLIDTVQAPAEFRQPRVGRRGAGVTMWNAWVAYGREGTITGADADGVGEITPIRIEGGGYIASPLANTAPSRPPIAQGTSTERVYYVAPDVTFAAPGPGGTLVTGGVAAGVRDGNNAPLPASLYNDPAVLALPARVPALPADAQARYDRARAKSLDQPHPDARWLKGVLEHPEPFSSASGWRFGPTGPDTAAAIIDEFSQHGVTVTPGPGRITVAAPLLPWAAQFAPTALRIEVLPLLGPELLVSPTPDAGWVAAGSGASVVIGGGLATLTATQDVISSLRAPLAASLSPPAAVHVEVETDSATAAAWYMSVISAAGNAQGPIGRELTAPGVWSGRFVLAGTAINRVEVDIPALGATSKNVVVRRLSARAETPLGWTVAGGLRSAAGAPDDTITVTGLSAGPHRVRLVWLMADGREWRRDSWRTWSVT